MRKIIVFLYSILFISCATMSMDNPDPSVTKYEKIIEFPGLTQAQLFESVNLWAVETFNKANSVIEYSNAETGTITGKFVYGTSVIGLLAAYVIDNVRCVMTINVKDNKVRIIIQFSEIHVNGGSMSTVRTWRTANKGEFEQIGFAEKCQEVALNFESYIKKNATADW